MKKQHKTPALRDLDYYIAEWLRPTGKRRSPQTARAYRADIAQFTEQVSTAFNLVTVEDIQNYQSFLGNEYDAERTIARKIASVFSFYRFLNAHGVTSLNMDRIERATVESAVNHDNLLTPEEVAAIIEAVAADPLHHALLRFLYLTGCRISEAINLRWRDLTPLETGGEAHIIGKRRAVRKSYIREDLWADLMALKGEAAKTDHPFPFTANWAWKIVRQAGKSVGIENAHPHMFRHAFVSHLLAKPDVSIVDVQMAVGHKSLATTTLYAHSLGGKNLADRLKVK